MRKVLNKKLTIRERSNTILALQRHSGPGALWHGHLWQGARAFFGIFPSMADAPVVHEFFMRGALQEAHLALQSAEVPVGAVVVVDDIIVGRGHNQRQTLPDPTAHAEM